MVYAGSQLYRVEYRLEAWRVSQGIEIGIVLDPVLVAIPLVQGTLETVQSLLVLAQRGVRARGVVQRDGIVRIYLRRAARILERSLALPGSGQYRPGQIVRASVIRVELDGPQRA